MKPKNLAAAVVFGLTAGTTSIATAISPCAGFTDVQSSDSYCNAVQWLKNRAITLGCTSATLYCPADVVTRASMALFMNRLGVALTPRFASLQAGTTAQSLAPGQFFPSCATTTLPAVGFPQTIRTRATISVQAAGPALQMFLVASLNSAGYINLNSTSLVVSGPNGLQNLSWTSNTLDIAPNTTVSFAVGISNPASAIGNLSVSPGLCAIEGEVFNTNPAVAPFDE